MRIPLKINFGPDYNVGDVPCLETPLRKLIESHYKEVFLGSGIQYIGCSIKKGDLLISIFFGNDDSQTGLSFKFSEIFSESNFDFDHEAPDYEKVARILEKYALKMRKICLSKSKLPTDPAAV